VSRLQLVDRPRGAPRCPQLAHEDRLVTEPYPRWLRALLWLGLAYFAVSAMVGTLVIARLAREIARGL
jgi:hypothetical protein